MRCSNCPLPSGMCIEWPALCNLIQNDPANDVHKLHIFNRSIQNYDIKPIIYSYQAERNQTIKSCPYRKPHTTCGCSEATCLLGKGKDGFVLWNDCEICLSNSGSL